MKNWGLGEVKCLSQDPQGESRSSKWSQDLNKSFASWICFHFTHYTHYQSSCLSALFLLWLLLVVLGLCFSAQISLVAANRFSCPESHQGLSFQSGVQTRDPTPLQRQDSLPTGPAEKSLNITPSDFQHLRHFFSLKTSWHLKLAQKPSKMDGGAMETSLDTGISLLVN